MTCIASRRAACICSHPLWSRLRRVAAAAALTASSTLPLAMASTLSGCGRGFVLETPSGFAELEDQQEYGYRATTAEGVVLAVRREDNAPYGDLAFWTGAIDAHLRREGYVADQAVDVQSADGVDGQQIRYHRNRDGREFVFWVSVFVTLDHVVVVEAGGDGEYFGKLETAVSAAIRSLELG